MFGNMPDRIHFSESGTPMTIRGRAAVINPGNRFERAHLHVLADTLEEEVRKNPAGRQVRTEVLEDHTRTIINPVNVPDVELKWTINPYRGCEHGCAYCYARPTHENLGFSCGLDFETRIVAKPNAAKLLRKELASPRWRGEAIHFSGVTDAYQPLEKRLRITRQCLEVIAECRQPIRIVTKNRLVTRDIDLLKELAHHQAVNVTFSLTTLNSQLAGKLEPRTSRPADRLRAIRQLTDAGIPTTAMLAPIIPGLNDREIPAILGASAEAGARSAIWLMLRLPYQTKALFVDWLERNLPDSHDRIVGLIRQIRGGRLYDSTYGQRFRGRGPLAEQIGRTFEVFSRRYGLAYGRSTLSSAAFRRPDGYSDGNQMMMFDT